MAKGAPPGGRSPWVSFAVVGVAAFLLLADVSLVNVAIPAIRRDLGATYGEAQLILAAYSLAFAALLVTGGRLGDLYGHRRLFLLGLGGFLAASTLCAFSLGPPMLIAARTVQGAFAGLLFPQVLAVLQTRFSPRQRGQAFGAHGGVIGFAVVTGPLLGGAITGLDLFGLSWRPIFLVNPVVGLFGVAGALLLLEESRVQAPRSLDAKGVALFTLAIFLLVWPLATARDAVWPWVSFALLAGAFPLLALFFAYQERRTRRGEGGLIDTRLFRSRAFTVGIFLQLALFFGVPVFFLCFVILLQSGLGLSPLAAGVALMPFALGEALASLLSARVAAELQRRALTLGALLLAAGFCSLGATLAHLGPAFTPLAGAPSLLLAGVGLGTAVPPLITVALTEVPEDEAGAAAGVLATMQRVGEAAGVAALGLLFFSLLPGEEAAEAAVFVRAATWTVLCEAGLYLGVAWLTLALPKQPPGDPLNRGRAASAP